MELRNSEEKYRSLFSALSEGVVMQDKNGKIIAANQSAEEILGVSLDQMMGKSSLDSSWKVIHEDGSPFPGHDHPAMVALQTGEPVSNVIMGVYKPNGSLTWIRIHAEPVLSTNKKEVNAVVASFTDISQQRAIQQTIRESEERFKKLSNLTFEGIFIHDEGTCIDANISFCELLQFGLDDLIGKDIVSMIIVPKEQQKVRKALQKVFVEPFETTAIRSDGHELPVEIECQQISWGNEKIMVSAIRDISERVKARNALLESELRFKTLSEVTHEGIIIHDQGIIHDINLSMQKMIGYSPEELSDKNLFELVPESYREEARKKIEEGFVGAYEIRIKRKDGSDFPAEIIVKESEIQGKKVRVASIRDLSDKKFADHEIRKLSTAVKQSPVSIVVTNTRGNIEFVNPAFTRVTGYSSEEVIGKSTSVLKSGKTPDSVYKSLWKTIAAGKVWRGEFLNKKKNGELYWEEAVIAPVKNEGKISNYLGIKENITQRKASEQKLRETLKELERSNKDLEQFAYASSHDLQEPLRKIRNYSELIVDKYKSQIDEQGKQYFDIISRGTIRMQNLIDDLLAYSRVSSKGQTFEDVDMNKIIRDVEDNLELTIFKSKARISASKLPYVRGDASQLYLLFQNLISNAIKFRSDVPPEITVKAELRKKSVLICVQDNGIGMDMKYADKVFTVFQRLHSREDYEGTGIGLAICKKIVERHFGNIWLESEPGKGTRFYVELPSTPIGSGP